MRTILRIERLQTRINETKRAKEASSRDVSSAKSLLEFKATYRKPSDNRPLSCISGKNAFKNRGKGKNEYSSNSSDSKSDHENGKMDMATVASIKLMSKEISK